jgi:hypothetical protein
MMNDENDNFGKENNNNFFYPPNQNVFPVSTSPSISQRVIPSAPISPCVVSVSSSSKPFPAALVTVTKSPLDEEMSSSSHSREPNSPKLYSNDIPETYPQKVEDIKFYFFSWIPTSFLGNYVIKQKKFHKQRKALEIHCTGSASSSNLFEYSCITFSSLSSLVHNALSYPAVPDSYIDYSPEQQRPLQSVNERKEETISSTVSQMKPPIPPSPLPPFMFPSAVIARSVKENTPIRSPFPHPVPSPAFSSFLSPKFVIHNATSPNTSVFSSVDMCFFKRFIHTVFSYDSAECLRLSLSVGTTTTMQLIHYARRIRRLPTASPEFQNELNSLSLSKKIPSTSFSNNSAVGTLDINVPTPPRKITSLPPLRSKLTSSVPLLTTYYTQYLSLPDELFESSLIPYPPKEMGGVIPSTAYWLAISHRFPEVLLMEENSLAPYFFAINNKYIFHESDSKSMGLSKSVNSLFTSKLRHTEGEENELQSPRLFESQLSKSAEYIYWLEQDGIIRHNNILWKQPSNSTNHIPASVHIPVAKQQPSEIQEYISIESLFSDAYIDDESLETSDEKNEIIPEEKRNVSDFEMINGKKSNTKENETKMFSFLFFL